MDKKRHSVLQKHKQPLLEEIVRSMDKYASWYTEDVREMPHADFVWTCFPLILGGFFRFAYIVSVVHFICIFALERTAASYFLREAPGCGQRRRDVPEKLFGSKYGINFGYSGKNGCCSLKNYKKSRKK
ncbi:unnamed protein product [Caenorhabditis auriculariae]|uniref:Uncharacterized protein n=1 Tax=Caenorhabditis auriculariae TaxID=2777116 RepID=A0A8S1H3Q1_9PELO|nr:unnamed protein product [Caenorhabditis auriculariae]